MRIRFLTMYCPSKLSPKGTSVKQISGSRTNRRKVPGIMVLGRAFAWRVGAALMLSCVGCGQGDAPTRQEEVELRSEVVYENGFEAVVQVDSVTWQLGRLNATIPDDVEIEGEFHFSLVNRLQDPVSVRYELRFLDEDDLLVDVFFPFGQPVELGAGESRQVTGSFVVRLGNVEDLRFVRTLRIVVQTTA